jgi:hypothetical protein
MLPSSADESVGVVPSHAAMLEASLVRLEWMDVLGTLLERWCAARGQVMALASLGDRRLDLRRGVPIGQLLLWDSQNPNEPLEGHSTDIGILRNPIAPPSGGLWGVTRFISPTGPSKGVA